MDDLVSTWSANRLSTDRAELRWDESGEEIANVITVIM